MANFKFLSICAAIGWYSVTMAVENGSPSKFVGRKHSIPILYTRGTFYEVGREMGRTFRGMIEDFVNNSAALAEYLAYYEKPEGRELYEKTLKNVERNYAQYLRELQGIADGARIPFYKLFLLHMDRMIPVILNSTSKTTMGCSSVSCNQKGQEILGHTEDASADTLGNFYIVDARISEPGFEDEHYASLCYAGYLPGFTMSNNAHGLIYSINVIHAKDLYDGGIPGFFITRSLLAAKNIADLKKRLENDGTGSAEGFSVNFTFMDEEGGVTDDLGVIQGVAKAQKGERIMYNVEVGPASALTKKSLLSFKSVRKGDETYLHCNRYLRLNARVPEEDGLIIENSDSRQAVYESLDHKPRTEEEIKTLLSHQDEENFTFFRDWSDDGETKSLEPIATLAVGFFNFLDGTWTLYADKPIDNEPLVVLKLLYKEKNHPDWRWSSFTTPEWVKKAWYTGRFKNIVKS